MGHGHSHSVDTSRDGLRALWISLAVLGVTAALQAAVVLVSGSVALLGDTLHNLADALTAVPLGIAFLLGRRPATRAYTYGFGRAEDLAGLVIVLVIAGSAVLAGVTAVQRLLDPRPIGHPGWVLAAGVIGFLGNEVVARYRIVVGRRIGSAALVADGLHARTDGFASLAVVVAAGGSWAGFAWADPVVGLVIALAICHVLLEAGREVYRRLMDGVDPHLVEHAERALRGVPGVRDVSALRMRWIGHRLHAEAGIVVDPALTVTAAHQIAHEAEHELSHVSVATATVHVGPAVRSAPG
jgi:cation diffusion facilitator family transporter